MASWGTKRRNTVLLVVFLLILIPLGIFIFLTLYEKPNCFDGKKNGDEQGVDCGGSCTLLCNDNVIDPLVHWSRYFEVVPGFYNAVAYLENQNTDAGTERLQYKFTFYDSENAVIAERTGRIELRPREIIPIFETGFNTGKVIPARMTFEILNTPVWERQNYRNPVIKVQDERITNVSGSPRVTAVLYNSGLEEVKDFETVVILYDRQDNAVGVSSTYTERIRSDGVRGVLFTWPMEFDREVVRFEIIPLYEAS